MATPELLPVSRRSVSYYADLQNSPLRQNPRSISSQISPSCRDRNLLHTRCKTMRS
jgi:hypothetical protein